MKRSIGQWRTIFGGILVIAVLVGFLLLSLLFRASTITGVVQDDVGPVEGAIVRVQATNLATTTNEKGEFILTGLPRGKKVSLTAWAPGYFVAGIKWVSVGRHDVAIRIEPHTKEDNPAYNWLSAFKQAGQEANCENCHASPRGYEALPFEEWNQDPHAHTTENVRFLTMYSGTDVNGNQSPPTRYGYNIDYGRFPLRPDPEKPYYGPGYKLDFPNTAGNCAACHAPAAAVNAPLGVDPREVTGVGAEGVTCDFCHKVWDVRLGPSGLPYSNMPGVLSYEFRRPPENQQFFAGPFDDINHILPEKHPSRFCAVCHLKESLTGWPYATRDTYVPIFQESRFCAPCHFGDFWGVRIYNSFGEWQSSPYRNPEAARSAGIEAKTCQDCHMSPGKSNHFVRLERGGLIRDPQKISSHNMRITPELLQQALTLTLNAVPEGDRLKVTVTVTNKGAGHHVPTDSPLRQVILLVQATDADGNPLPLLEGPVIPPWGGEGSLAEGYYAGSPGKIYAKTLEEMWTGVAPTGAYWNHTRILEDTRIPALGSDIAVFIFSLNPSLETVEVQAQLLYRRAFRELQDQKGWEISDVTMETATISVNR